MRENSNKRAPRWDRLGAFEVEHRGLCDPARMTKESRKGDTGPSTGSEQRSDLFLNSILSFILVGGTVAKGSHQLRRPGGRRGLARGGSWGGGGKCSDLRYILKV